MPEVGVSLALRRQNNLLENNRNDNNNNNNATAQKKRHHLEKPSLSTEEKTSVNEDDTTTTTTTITATNKMTKKKSKKKDKSSSSSSSSMTSTAVARKQQSSSSSSSMNSSLQIFLEVAILYVSCLILPSIFKMFVNLYSNRWNADHGIFYLTLESFCSYTWISDTMVSMCRSLSSDNSNLMTNDSLTLHTTINNSNDYSRSSGDSGTLLQQDGGASSSSSSFTDPMAPDTGMTDVAIVVLFSLSMAVVRILLVHFLVPSYLVQPKRLEVLVRCKSVHLLSSTYQRTVTPRSSMVMSNRTNNNNINDMPMPLLAPPIPTLLDGDYKVDDDNEGTNNITRLSASIRPARYSTQEWQERKEEYHIDNNNINNNNNNPSNESSGWLFFDEDNGDDDDDDDDDENQMDPAPAVSSGLMTSSSAHSLQALLQQATVVTPPPLLPHNIPTTRTTTTTTLSNAKTGEAAATATITTTVSPSLSRTNSQDDFQSPDGMDRLFAAPKYATAVFRLIFCTVSCIIALRYFVNADFWPPAVGGHGDTKYCWDLSSVGTSVMDSDFDQHNTVLRRYFLLQASYHFHSAAFHLVAALLLWFVSSRSRSNNNNRSNKKLLFGIIPTGMVTMDNVRTFFQHCFAVGVIAATYLFSSLRRLAVIGMFAFDLSSWFLHLLQMCINAPPKSLLRNSPRLIKILHCGFVIPAFCYSRFYVFPFVLGYSALVESQNWLTQLDHLWVSGAAWYIRLLFAICLALLMLLNTVYMRRLLYHPHVKELLS